MNDRRLHVKLSVVGLNASYFTSKGIVKAVDNITFAIGENESLGIAGESASGKSTLGSALLRALQPPGKIMILINRFAGKKLQ